MNSKFKTFKQNSILDSFGFTGAFYQTLKEKYNLFLKKTPKIEKEKILLNSFYEVSVTVISN